MGDSMKNLDGGQEYTQEQIQKAIEAIKDLDSKQINNAFTMEKTNMIIKFED